MIADLFGPVSRFLPWTSAGRRQASPAVDVPDAIMRSTVRALLPCGRPFRLDYGVLIGCSHDEPSAMVVLFDDGTRFHSAALDSQRDDVLRYIVRMHLSVFRLSRLRYFVAHADLGHPDVVEFVALPDEMVRQRIATHQDGQWPISQRDLDRFRRAFGEQRLPRRAQIPAAFPVLPPTGGEVVAA